MTLITIHNQKGGWRVDLRLLRTFMVAARLQNFHQAADKLYMAQPTVTSHIRQLEETLGYPLFERVGKRVRLTPAGERFLPHAAKVIETYEHALQDMTAWRQGFDSRLRLVVSPLVATSVLPPVLKRFTVAHPRVEVVVLTAASPDVSAAVAEGQAHIGLSRMPAHLQETASEVLYQDPVVLVASPAAAVPGQSWHELLATQLVMTRNHPVYWDDLLLALAEHQPWMRTLEVDRVDVTKRMVEEGLGVSFLPRSSVTRELEEGRLVAVPVPDMNLPVAATYMITSTVHPLPEPARQFVALLREAFASDRA